jgi:arabinose-5-phosphate isomerase
VEDIMHVGDAIPIVREHETLGTAVVEVSKKGLGMTAVVDRNEVLTGIFTDGDLRRALDHGVDIRATRISEVMTRNCKTATAGMLAAEALNVMQDAKISALLITDDQGKLIGALNMHDLLKAGVA